MDSSTRPVSNDVFAMTHTGYGSSPKPMMGDPCNADAAFQHHLIPHVLNSKPEAG